MEEAEEGSWRAEEGRPKEVEVEGRHPHRKSMASSSKPKLSSGSGDLSSLREDMSTEKFNAHKANLKRKDSKDLHRNTITLHFIVNSIGEELHGEINLHRISDTANRRKLKL